MQSSPQTSVLYLEIFPILLHQMARCHSRRTDLLRLDRCEDLAAHWYAIRNQIRKSSLSFKQTNFCGSRKYRFKSIQCTYSRFDEKRKRKFSGSSKHAVIHVFDIFRVDSFYLDAVKTWQLIDTLCENNSKMFAELQQANFCGSRKSLFESIQCSHSRFDEREKKSFWSAGYITKLREQWGAIRARREAVIARGKRKKTPTVMV